jgi:hypothetical protein
LNGWALSGRESRLLKPADAPRNVSQMAGSRGNADLTLLDQQAKKHLPVIVLIMLAPAVRQAVGRWSPEHQAVQ